LTRTADVDRQGLVAAVIAWNPIQTNRQRLTTVLCKIAFGLSTDILKRCAGPYEL